MIKLVLLTGFLGAGKTTLLQRLLEHFGNEPTGLIVNDFGKVNIDARLLEQDGIAMAELENGSIFCSCIKENFINALIRLSGENLTYLFIEASGLADPGNMAQILAVVGSRGSRPYDYRGSVCVLDGESFLEMADLLPAIGNQLKHASAVLVNKEDLLCQERISRIRERIGEINREAPLFFTSYCEIDIDDVIEGLASSKEEAGESTNTPENRPYSLILRQNDNLTMEELRSFLSHIAPRTYRIKGFARLSGKAYSISGVGTHIMILPWKGEIASPEIVLISSVGIGITGAVSEGIGKYASRSLRL